MQACGWQLPAVNSGASAEASGGDVFLGPGDVEPGAGLVIPGADPEPLGPLVEFSPDAPGGWTLPADRVPCDTPMSILPDLPPAPKRGRPVGSGTGSRMLRAYLKETERQEREAAEAAEQALLPAAGTAAYARSFKQRKSRDSADTATLPLSMPMPLSLVQSLEDAPDKMTSELAKILATSTAGKGSGQAQRSVAAFEKVRDFIRASDQPADHGWKRR